MGRSSFRVCVLDSPSVSCLLSCKKSSPASLSSSPSLHPQQNPLDSHHHSPGLPRAPLPTYHTPSLRLSIQPFNLLLILPLRSTLPLTNGKNGLPLLAKNHHLRLHPLQCGQNSSPPQAANSSSRYNLACLYPQITASLTRGSHLIASSMSTA